MAATDGQQRPAATEPARRPGAGASPEDAAEWLRAHGVLADAVQAGEMVPDFELADAAGTPVSLGSLLDRGPLIINFILGRGSPVCRATLRAVQDILPLITRHHATVVAISCDPPAISRRVAQEEGLGFALLADDDGHLGQLFGLRYQPPEPLAAWHDLLGFTASGADAPSHFVLPATYVINAEGIAVYAFLDPHPRRRVDPHALIDCLSRMD